MIQRLYIAFFLAFLLSTVAAAAANDEQVLIGNIISVEETGPGAL